MKTFFFHAWFLIRQFAYLVGSIVLNVTSLFLLSWLALWHKFSSSWVIVSSILYIISATPLSVSLACNNVSSAAFKFLFPLIFGKRRCYAKFSNFSKQLFCFQKQTLCNKQNKLFQPSISTLKLSNPSSKSSKEWRFRKRLKLRRVPPGGRFLKYLLLSVTKPSIEPFCWYPEILV